MGRGNSTEPVPSAPTEEALGQRGCPGTDTPSPNRTYTPKAALPHPRLTFQLEQRVVHLALDLPRALHGARHPQPLVERLGRDDVVPRVGCHLPLGQGGADDDADPAQEGQHEAQEL